MLFFKGLKGDKICLKGQFQRKVQSLHTVHVRWLKKVKR